MRANLNRFSGNGGRFLLLASVGVLIATPAWVAAGGGGGPDCWREIPTQACDGVPPPPGYTCISPRINEPCSKTEPGDGAKIRNGYDRTSSFYPGALQPDGSCKATGPYLSYTIRCYEAVGEACTHTPN